MPNIIRGGGGGIPRTKDPTINILSTTSSSVTFTLKNNDLKTSNVFYETSSVNLNSQFVLLSGGSTSSNLTVPGLTATTTYQMKAIAVATDSSRAPSKATSQEFTTSFPSGQQAYTSPGTHTFTVPSNITSLSAMVVGGGGAGGGGADGHNGGGGGGLSWGTIPVTPGQQLTVFVGSGGTAVASGNAGANGEPSYIRFSGTDFLFGGGGNGGGNGVNGTNSSDGGGNGGTSSGIYRGGGGNGGKGGTNSPAGSTADDENGGGGGGAGGYTSNGGNGQNASFYTTSGEWSGSGGGGVGINGGSSGGEGGYAYNPSLGFAQGAQGGSGGTSSSNAGTAAASNGGSYGGGGGGGEETDKANGSGSSGAIRIIWGTNRSYPSTNTANQ
jgi:hypothetical protein